MEEKREGQGWGGTWKRRGATIWGGQRGIGEDGGHWDKRGDGGDTRMGSNGEMGGGGCIAPLLLSPAPPPKPRPPAPKPRPPAIYPHSTRPRSDHAPSAEATPTFCRQTTPTPPQAPPPDLIHLGLGLLQPPIAGEVGGGRGGAPTFSTSGGGGRGGGGGGRPRNGVGGVGGGVKGHRATPLSSSNPPPSLFSPHPRRD